MRERHGSAPQFPFDQRKLKMAQPRTANTFREVAGIKPQVDGLLLYCLGYVMGHLSGALNFCLMRVDLILHKAAHGGDDHLLFFSQSKMHGNYPFA